MSYSRHLSRKTNEIREIGKDRKPEKNTYRKKKTKQAKQKKRFGLDHQRRSSKADKTKQNKNRIIIKTAREKEKWGAHQINE